MASFDSWRGTDGVVFEQCVTAEAASRLTGYNIQHIRRLTYAGKLDAIRVGRSWLIRVKSTSPSRHTRLKWLLRAIAVSGQRLVSTTAVPSAEGARSIWRRSMARSQIECRVG